MDHLKKDSGITESTRIETFLFVLVLTAPKSLQRRKVIRETWIEQSKIKTFVTRFVIGGKTLSSEERKSLDSENKRYGDLLILENLEDGYKRLSLKVLETIKWIDSNVDCSYVLKVDDDSFVRLDLLVNELKTVYNQDNLYWGFFRGDANVKKRGPWAEKNWILCDHYLPYADGGGYVLASKLVRFVARNSELLQLYNSEDVSVGAWLAPLKIHRVHDTRFNTEYRSRGCNNKHLISHKQSVEDMKDKYSSLEETDNLCREEIEEMRSFEYDWKVPPSQCCKRTYGLP
ncbi:predicted protein [Nematostella vectensis]|uniref:Hexosyltransferase n=1 Tax=Nematostella vectensis TaxID=45351 RepID=A7SZM8_NEMVE|nr:predicted protein [Nematostella vectensis]|eukprot:XP_001622942.1 predicted protein [Nematostella vectensis]